MLQHSKLPPPILYRLVPASLLALAAVGCTQHRLEEPDLQTPPPIVEPTPVSAQGEGARPVATQPLVQPLPVPADSELSSQRPKAPKRPRQVLIDSGKPAPEKLSLVEASRRAKALKANAGEPVAVITDENLKDYAARGKLTMAHPTSRPVQPSAPSSSVGGSSDSTPEVSEEEYWSERVRTLRQGWRDAVDAMADLEARAETLRTQFYAADDPRLRDTRIKPEWDRALDLIQQRRRDATRYQEELALALEEGRRAGALPGWLRTGYDLEPPPSKPAKADLDAHDPREPVILEENP